MLSFSRHGAASALPPLLIVHGLFGSARNWGAIARRLGRDREVVTVDMRNHGESFHSDTHRYPDMAADLAEVIGEIGGHADVLGHSMGGKAAMMLALGHPRLVDRLIVADVAPVAYRHSQQRQIDAMRRVDLARVTNRSEAAAMMQADSPEVAAFLLQNLDLASRRWRLDFDMFEREMPMIVGFPEVAGRFEGPVLFLSGALSDYVLPEHRDRIRALFPHARFAKIPGAGHWLHADNPKAFIESSQVFLGVGRQGGDAGNGAGSPA